MDLDKWNIWGRLKPETAAEVEEVKTVEGMRKRIYEYARADALTKTMLEHGRWNGLSGDDMMTALAYHALIEREKYRDMVLEQTMLQPMPPMIVTPPPPNR